MPMSGRQCLIHLTGFECRKALIVNCEWKKPGDHLNESISDDGFLHYTWVSVEVSKWLVNRLNLPINRVYCGVITHLFLGHPSKFAQICLFASTGSSCALCAFIRSACCLWSEVWDWSLGFGHQKGKLQWIMPMLDVACGKNPLHFPELENFHMYLYHTYI